MFMSDRSYRRGVPLCGAAVLALGTLVAAPVGPAAAHAEPAVPATADAEPTGPLHLGTALALVLERNPELSASALRLDATEARRQQAAARPNPELVVSVEDLAGTGTFSGVQEAQTTLQVSQLVELGGKRAARMRTAEGARDIARWDYETTRLDACAATVRAFVAVLGAQEQLALAGDAVVLAQDVVHTARRRVQAGAASPVEVTKANMALADAQAERSRRQRALDVARARLAAKWNAPVPRFSEAQGALDAIKPVPHLDDLREQLARNPDLARWASELAHRQAAVDVERSRAVPDVTAGAGYRRLSGPEENAFVFEFAVPLPVADRNRWAIVEAQRLVDAGRAEQRRAERAVATAVIETHAALASAAEQIGVLRAQVLPAAASAFDTVERGYRDGRFGYLEVLDAQRTLIAARARHIRALVAYHQAVATLERLTGAPLPGDAARQGD